MKSVISQMSKVSILKATLAASVFAYASNAFFNASGSMLFDADLVNTTNNVIDSLQLAAYVAIKLQINRSLSRFDVPFIVGGLVAIFA